jgi:hypothetical protein
LPSVRKTKFLKYKGETQQTLSWVSLFNSYGICNYSDFYYVLLASSDPELADDF